MTEVSPTRLWVMRAMYLFMAIGIGNMIWPLIISHASTVPRMTGVAWALIGTIGLLALLGLRYPLQMLPLLLVELVWKLIWLTAFALPRWLDGTLDEAMRTSVFETSFGLVLLLVIPWRYLWANYVIRPGDPWTFRRPGRDRRRLMA
jgi:hypothetical protein